MEETTIYILIICFLATLFRSTFGFGESLIAVPLFIFFIPIYEAVPLSVLMSVLVAFAVVVQDHRQVDMRSAKWLILFATLGIPIGLLMLVYGNQLIIKITLGTLIVLYSLYSLWGNINLGEAKESKSWLFVCGFLSGILGGAYGLNGPPLVIYGNKMKWSAQYFRATLQAYFLPVGIISVAGYFAQSLISERVLLYFLYSIPAIIPAIFLGRYFNSKLNGKSFYKYAYIGLVVIGLILILNSMQDIV